MFRQALILASGLGTRMKPITDKIPKPMVEICGQSMISRAIDQLHAAGIKKIVITTFYKADILQNHVLSYVKEKNLAIDIAFVIEDELHEVWGSIKKALPYLQPGPFLLVNGDAYWVDSNSNVIDFMYKNWTSQMKALVLLYPIERALGYEGKGDFDLQDGLIVIPSPELISTSSSRAISGAHVAISTLTPLDACSPSGQSNSRNGISSRRAEAKPYAYIGFQIINPEFLQDEPLAKASIFHIYDKMDYKGIHGAVYDGYWFHVGTPESIIETEEFLAEHGLL